MGFEVEQTAVLRFDNTHFKGAEVTVSITVPMSEVFKFDALKLRTPTTPDELQPYIEFMLPLIKEWNLERGGVPVPLTPEGFSSLGWQIILAIVRAWGIATTELSLPLGSPPADGSTSAEPPA